MEDDSESPSHGNGDTILEPGHYTLKPGVWPINLASSASDHWTDQDAVAELLRNQKEAIMNRYSLQSEDYLALKEIDDGNHCTFAIRHPTSEVNSEKELLGYISFDKERTTIEIANLDSKLSLRSMQLGGTTQLRGFGASRSQGHGLKLAAFRLLRSGYGVQYAANIYRWTFELRGTKSNPGLVCHLKPETKRILNDQKSRFAQIK
ncbi:hypothetical protein PVAG01_04200 [Phlyctema vagabunda]|uniref:Uncharacterized protein n=1 Tax=Phlyctema vagabunda TaxID=108571 RepID=A0ABR4PNK0_9HELO